MWTWTVRLPLPAAPVATAVMVVPAKRVQIRGKMAALVKLVKKAAMAVTVATAACLSPRIL